jgi:hypothetical protein
VKIRDLINAVDRSEKNTDSADIDEFCRALNLNEYPGWNKQFDEAVKGHWLIKWYCTDTWVGYQVYYMDNEPVAISVQTARKSSASYQFVSLEAATKLRKFILECLGESEFTPDIMDQDEETDPYYTVSYSSQLLVKEGFFDGRVTKVVRECHRWDDPELKMDEMFVSFSDDPETVFKINVRDFKIPMHVTSAILLGIDKLN